jgi:ABC-type phosphate/phosphonate transport system substrate-binding protein
LTAPGIANARMYAVAPGAAAAWDVIFDHLIAATGIGMEKLHHAMPTPIAELWARKNLACTFLCGWPWAEEGFLRRGLAAPVLVEEAAPQYRSRLVVRADSPFRVLEDTFGHRVGWTLRDSHSGFSALRHHLLAHRTPARPRLYAQSIGPINTPRKIIEAVVANEIDVGPVDSFAFWTLSRHAPELTRQVRVIDSTEAVAVPLLVADPSRPEAESAALQAALVTLHETEAGRALLEPVGVTRFVRPDQALYRRTLDWARAAEAAGYARPE